MKSTWTILTTLYIVIYLPSILSRSLSKRAAFYIANETACVVDSIVYYNGDPIPTDDPCEACKCRPPGFACVLRECEVKPGCRAVRKAGHCCPDYICGCEHNGRMFRDGDEIRDSQNPCYTCHCQGSAIACAFVDCFFRVDCAPEYVPGECCPRYDHCSPLGTPLNGTTSSKQPPTTTTIKTTAGIEVFTEDPFFGFADFGADGSVEGLRRKQMTTTKVPDVPSDISAVSLKSSTTVSTVETSARSSENEDSTTPTFYVPEKDSATENRDKPAEDATKVPDDKSTEEVVKILDDPTTTKQSNAEPASTATEESISKPNNDEENIKNDPTVNLSQQEPPTTEQSSKLLLYSDKDEHNFSNEFLADAAEKENEEKVIPSEIHDAQDHGKENIENLDENMITTTEKQATKIVFGDRIKSTSTIAPIPILLSDSKVQDEYDNDKSKSSVVPTEVNKELTDTVEKGLSNTEEDLNDTQNEKNKQIINTEPPTEHNNDQDPNLTESTSSDIASNKTKREGKKKNVIVDDQKLSTELPPSTVNFETKQDNSQTEYLTTPSTSYDTAKSTEKSNEEEYKTQYKVKLDTTPTIVNENTETSAKKNPTQIREAIKLSNPETTIKDFSTLVTSSTVATSLSESETKSTSSLQTEVVNDKDIHIGHEITL